MRVHSSFFVVEESETAAVFGPFVGDLPQSNKSNSVIPNKVYSPKKLTRIMLNRINTV